MKLQKQAFPRGGRLTGLVFFFAFTAMAATEVATDPQFVFLRTDTSSFWRTATNHVVTLPVRYPDRATAATLSVTGESYSRTYDNIPEGDYVLSLPAPVSPETENVYDLALSFDDGTVRTAKLGVIEGMGTDGEGATRCISPDANRKWGRMRRRAVMPIPCGVTAFSVRVNGTEVASDTGLDGARGWYALDGVNRGDEVSLSFTTNSASCSADLTGRGNPYVTFRIR